MKVFHQFSIDRIKYYEHNINIIQFIAINYKDNRISIRKYIFDV